MVAHSKNSISRGTDAVGYQLLGLITAVEHLRLYTRPSRLCFRDELVHLPLGIGHASLHRLPQPFELLRHRVDTLGMCRSKRVHLFHCPEALLALNRGDLLNLFSEASNEAGQGSFQLLDSRTVCLLQPAFPPHDALQALRVRICSLQKCVHSVELGRQSPLVVEPSMRDTDGLCMCVPLQGQLPGRYLQRVLCGICSVQGFVPLLACLFHCSKHVVIDLLLLLYELLQVIEALLVTVELCLHGRKLLGGKVDTVF
mmetsp:Transcript_1999/g.5976  ORF Transcript_1999/g.5976 Transcript_1999/m.5976 type:complete len:256 (-) Transcript_1999:857-1624(-)